MKTSRISSPPANPTTPAHPPRRGRVDQAVAYTLERLAAGISEAPSDAGAVEYASWLRLLRRPAP
ncbi:MAG: hypothetical protein ABIR94_20935 [Rubrivivax sp.]